MSNSTPQRGDQRRTALLESLDSLLQDEKRHLDSINIAEISRRAGVTRSAFYFYFENKQVAVAALSNEMYDEVFAAAAQLEGDAGPAANIEATIRQVFGAWDKHQHLYRAMLEARATNSAVREMWDSDRASFIEPVAAVIDAERAAGNAPGGPSAVDSRALATVLLDLNDRMLERLSRGTEIDREALTNATVTVWVNAIYGRTE